MREIKSEGNRIRRMIKKCKRKHKNWLVRKYHYVWVKNCKGTLMRKYKDMLIRKYKGMLTRICNKSKEKKMKTARVHNVKIPHNLLYCANRNKPEFYLLYFTIILIITHSLPLIN